jgi:hypothetical protein
MKKLIMFAVAAGCFGCLHTREVDKGQGAETAEGEPNKDAQGKGARGKDAPKKDVQKEDPLATDDSKKERAKWEREKKPAAAVDEKKPTSPTARAPAEEGRPELSVSPDGLLLPEGPRLIQQALVKRGYLPKDHQTGALDKETSGALRRFQGDQKLAKTGAPDRETVRRLGLSIGKVFRSVEHPGANV